LKFRFLFIGKTREKYLADGIKDYLGRIRSYVPSEQVILKGVKARDSMAEAVRAEDTKRLLEALNPSDTFVHLDPGGKEMTSRRLAAWLKDRSDHGAKAIAFGLGGPLGLTDDAAKRADLRLCLSRMTLTHEMCRLVLLEQIYRCMRMNAGHPYHK
jgi:23S rRNA (pseudouridine1915-N3)-methyltransferase